jgi:hypothetical protein
MTRKFYTRDDFIQLIHLESSNKKLQEQFNIKSYNGEIIEFNDDRFEILSKLFPDAEKNAIYSICFNAKIYNDIIDFIVYDGNDFMILCSYYLGENKLSAYITSIQDEVLFCLWNIRLLFSLRSICYDKVNNALERYFEKSIYHIDDPAIYWPDIKTVFRI